MRRHTGVLVGGVMAMLTMLLIGTGPSGAASPNQAVTSKSVRIGIPYVDFSSLHAVGIKLTQGSFPDAYKALIANINKHGGIHGRHLVASFAAVNPTGSAATVAVCTQMTEDQPIFVAMSPYMPDCYLEQHKTPTVNATFEGSVSKSAAPNFTLTPPANAYDPIQLSVFSKMGLFKNKKVGIFAGSVTDKSELQVVRQSLRRLRVKVVQTAVNSAPATDQTASNQQIGLIAQRFQEAGIDLVVAVGTGSSSWAAGLLANQSSYNPKWIATNATALSGSIGGSTGNNSEYFKTVVTSLPVPSWPNVWKEPSMQRCVKIIERAYPKDQITTPTLKGNGSDHTYIAPMQACQNLAMFQKIADAAGKQLSVATFSKAGYGLRRVTFPGSGGPVSFGPGRAYATGPVYVGKYSAAANQLVYTKRSATS